MSTLSELVPAGLWLGLSGLQIAAAWRSIRADARLSPADSAAGLTLLQPILGGDPALEDCLASAGAAATSGARFVWVVDEDDPLGRHTARLALARLGPDARDAVRIMVVPPVDALGGDDDRPVNPKAAKLALALAAVDTEFVGVLDDDTTVGPLHLRRALGALAGDAALYTGLPSYAQDGLGAGSALVTGFVNGSAARTYLGARALGEPLTINGMFWVTRTGELCALGGFDAIRHELCDDLAIARLYQARGKRIAQGSTAQVLVTRGLDFGAYLGRMHRWCVFARVLLARVALAERFVIVGFGLGGPVLLWAMLLYAFGSLNAAVAAAAAIALRALLLARVARATRDPSNERSASVVPFASLVAELLLPLHALHAFVAPTIRWRTRRYRVGARGQFREVER